MYVRLGFAHHNHIINHNHINIINRINSNISSSSMLASGANGMVVEDDGAGEEEVDGGELETGDLSIVESCNCTECCGLSRVLDSVVLWIEL